MGRKPRRFFTEKEKAYIRNHYAADTGAEIGAVLGRNHRVIDWWAESHGLTSSDDKKARIRAARIANMCRGLDEAAIQKRTQTIRRKRRMERFREISGMQRHTKWPKQTLTKRGYQATYNLRKKYGYIADEYDCSVLHIDENTHRVDEEYYAKRYGIKFVERVKQAEIEIREE